MKTKTKPPQKKNKIKIKRFELKAFLSEIGIQKNVIKKKLYRRCMIFLFFKPPINFFSGNMRKSLKKKKKSKSKTFRF